MRNVQVVSFNEGTVEAGTVRLQPEESKTIQEDQLDSRFMTAYGNMVVIANLDGIVEHIGALLTKSHYAYIKHVIGWDLTAALAAEEERDEEDDQGGKEPGKESAGAEVGIAGGVEGGAPEGPGEEGEGGDDGASGGPESGGDQEPAEEGGEEAGEPDQEGAGGDEEVAPEADSPPEVTTGKGKKKKAGKGKKK